MIRVLHRSNRRAALLAAVSTAATLAATAGVASATVWINPNSGNWSDGTKWVGGVAPVSSNTTDLTFNATLAETYTATNDIAAPFQLNALTFLNNGSGQINLNGSQLSFGGIAPAINQNGSGAVSVSNAIEIQSSADQTALLIAGSGVGALNLSGALSSNPAPTGTGGGYINQTGLATTNLSGGGSLYGIGSSQGVMNLTAGAYTFSSTERGNDVVGAVNDLGQWGVAIGQTPGQTARLTVAAGVTINTNSFMVGDGGVGIGTISGGTITMPQTGNVFFGINSGTGTLTVNNGSRVTTNFVDIGRQAGSNATFVLDGANTRLDAIQVVERAGITSSTISNGAVLNVGTGNGNGNTFFPTNTGGTGSLTITTNGLLTQGNQQTVGAGTNSTAFVTISAGGDWISTAGNAFIASSTAGVGAKANVTVTGAGSTFQALRPAAAGGQFSLGNIGEATLSVLDGGMTQSTTMFLASTAAGRGTLNVSGPNSVVMNNDVIVATGGGTNAGQSTVTVSNGGAIRSQRLTFGQNALGVTNVLATGASTITTQGVGAGTGSWATGLGSTDAVAVINIQNGAFAGAAGAIFLSGGVGTNSGGNTTFNVNNARAVAGFIQIGQNEFGNGTFNILGGGSATVASNTIVGRKATAAGTFTVSGTGSTLNTPGIVAAFNDTGPLGDPIPGGSGYVAVTAGGLVNSTGFGVTVASGEESNARLIVSGTNSRLLGTGTAQLVIGSSGNGSLNVENGALMTMAGNAFFGANPTSTSTSLVSAGTLAIGNQFQLGGSGGDDGGASVFTVTNNGTVSTVGQATVYMPGTLNVGVGTSVGRFTGGGDMAVDGTVNYNAGVLSAAGTVTVAGNVLLSTAARNGAGTPSNKKLLEVGQATLTTSGVIDLNDNDMLIHDTTAGARQKYENFIRLARNGAAWNMPGITSTAAKNSVPKNKNLGIISGSEFTSAGGSMFNGKSVVATDTLIKFTFNGDTDLNGVVNFDDYARVDNGFNNTRSGWFNGDFDFNGQVNFDDYSLIDQAFNTQGAVVLASGQGELAGPGLDRTIVRFDHRGVLAMLSGGNIVMQNGSEAFAESAIEADGAIVGGGTLRAVPEPTTIGLIGVAMLAAMRRRRRSN